MESTALHCWGDNIVGPWLEFSNHFWSRVDVLASLWIKLTSYRFLLFSTKSIDFEGEESFCPQRVKVLLGRVTLGLVLPVP